VLRPPDPPPGTVVAGLAFWCSWVVRPHDREVFGPDVDDPAKQDSIRPFELFTQSDTAFKEAGQLPAPPSGAQRR